MQYMLPVLQFFLNLKSNMERFIYVDGKLLDVPAPI